MRFAADIWLWGVLFSLLLAGIFVGQGLRLTRAKRVFGQEERVNDLLTSRTGGRRAFSAIVTCLAVAIAFVAAAQPQYGRGTRVLPATNLDVVLVLDFSKSMYARDVSPSRIGRAKVEVARLVRELTGARFGAVAFAGESISFPLTSDGAAIAQFFRGLEPNDMPLGGTAIARALETGRQLLERDPLSKNHERVIILVTDGEDLEGDPVEVARGIRSSGMRVEVVQVGGQAPEPIPQIAEDGSMQGLRRDAQGQILTTSLSVEGEAQLASVATEGGGQVVRAAAGQVGLDEMTARLRKLMTEELSERVETVYADVFHYPLALAVVLLMLEVWVGTAKRRVIVPPPPRGKQKKRRLRRLQGSAALLALMGLGCDDIDHLFERKAPAVEEAIKFIAQQNHDEATEKLIDYLETGPCEEGVIGVGDRARNYQDAAFDLALALSAPSQPEKKGLAADPSAALAQGQIPGLSPDPQASSPGASPSAPSDPEGGLKMDCALRLLAPIGPNDELPAALRARSYYLAGNLELSRARFEPAVSFFDQALLLAPGVKEGDPIGAQIAYNRALALRLLKEEEEKKKQEQQNSDQNEDDSEQDDGESEEKESEDGSEQEQEQEEQDSDDEEQKQDSDNEEQKEQDSDGEEQEQDDSSKDSASDDESKEEEQEQNSASDKEDEEQKKEAPTQPPPSSQKPQQAQSNEEQARDERMLDMLEQAPTLQQHDAERRKGQAVRGRATMEDK